MGYSTYGQSFVVFCQGRPCQLYSDWCSVSTQACGGGLRWCLDVPARGCVRWLWLIFYNNIHNSDHCPRLPCYLTTPSRSRQLQQRTKFTKKWPRYFILLDFLVNCIFPVKAAIIVVHFLSHNNSQQTWDPVRAVGHLDSWTVWHTAGLLLPDGQMISSEFTKIGKILARWYLEQWRARGEPVGVVFVIRPDHWEIVLHGTELGTIIHVRGEERTIQTDINKVGPTQIPSQRSLCFSQRAFRSSETSQISHVSHWNYDINWFTE